MLLSKLSGVKLPAEDWFLREIGSVYPLLWYRFQLRSIESPLFILKNGEVHLSTISNVCTEASFLLLAVTVSVLVIPTTGLVSAIDR